MTMPVRATTTEAIEPAADRAKRGAKILDKIKRGWAKRVVLDRFDMYEKDVLWWTFRDYQDGRATVRDHVGGDMFMAADYGFTIYEAELAAGRIRYGTDTIAWKKACEPLTAAWRAEIRARVA